jgi:hypothetical protein
VHLSKRSEWFGLHAQHSSSAPVDSFQFALLLLDASINSKSLHFFQTTAVLFLLDEIIHTGFYDSLLPQELGEATSRVQAHQGERDKGRVLSFTYVETRINPFIGNHWSRYHGVVISSYSLTDTQKVLYPRFN